jgi:hypothetical protein
LQIGFIQFSSSTLLQKVADCDSILFPMGSSRLLDRDVVIPLITAGLAVVAEGGDPSVRDASTFDGAKCSLADLHQVMERLLILRSPTSALALFICLGHQRLFRICG